MVTFENLALIHRLRHSEKVTKAVIARQLGIPRNTVVKALAANLPQRYHRPLAGTAFDAVEQQVRALLAKPPLMPATLLAERLGWVGSPSWFLGQIRMDGPHYAPKDAASRLRHVPGDPCDQVQCDLWFRRPDSRG
ncbi:hypothetical protein [Frigoribacterium sp. CFBP 13712]|uniref:hypothetical protein n=1 Tax=Frigoribacterium sp. CFBP 13712 TaxID=2775309 RepID=UPI00177D547C|nr:hypothetical protein [Frigoribacterium sp. CFBP 13712]MBD8703981.1 hypothetical protein [Frigoribacterium sp. CFBP 13712]